MFKLGTPGIFETQDFHIIDHLRMFNSATTATTDLQQAVHSCFPCRKADLQELQKKHGVALVPCFWSEMILRPKELPKIDRQKSFHKFTVVQNKFSKSIVSYYHIVSTGLTGYIFRTYTNTLVKLSWTPDLGSQLCRTAPARCWQAHDTHRPNEDPGRHAIVEAPKCRKPASDNKMISV